jgi:hypothetical protein
MATQCGKCGSHDIGVLENLGDGRKRLKCRACGSQWLGREAKPAPKTVITIEALHGSFPVSGDASPGAMERASELKERFLRERPNPRPRAAAFGKGYAETFSRKGLPRATPDELRSFANANIGGHPGNMSIFNGEWDSLGDEVAAQRVRDSVEYLLYPKDESHIEDRLTDLIRGERGFGMKGFRESLLTKLLAMVQPERFLPILKYTAKAGKREVSKSVYGLTLPPSDTVDWTIGRLIFWSNDLLVELVGDGFVDTAHAAEFLWWAKDQSAPSTDPPH